MKMVMYFCLKEHLKLIMKKKSMLPKCASDWSAFVFTICGVPSICVFELMWVLPNFYNFEHEIVKASIHSFNGIFILINVLGNLCKIFTTDISSGSFVMPSTLQKNWRFCPVCEANSPPRSYHCNICGICVLRRDHHCTFTGCCIGFHNYRYYYMFLFHLTIGALYATIFNMPVIFALLGGFNLFNVMIHIFPVATWLVGYIDYKLLIWISLSSVCGYVFIFGTVLMFYHATFFLKGQTAFEKSKNIETYCYGSWKDHVVDYFGSRWYFVWVFPSIHSPILGDGIHFMTKDKYLTDSAKNQ
ncbi:putative palmitoyltransferase ZDHHC24 [Nymphon striatum]|nr:putative palmitoyltransferase ZDHHC24 [Nymphon striatum]